MIDLAVLHFDAREMRDPANGGGVNAHESSL
jgi:hypothetical protein